MLITPKLQEFKTQLKSLSLIESEIKLADGGQSYIEELPAEYVSQSSQTQDVLTIVMQQFNMSRTGDYSCFNQMIRC